MTDTPKVDEPKTLYLTILDDKDDVTGTLIVRPVPGDDRGRKEMVIFASGHTEPMSVIFTRDDISRFIEGLKE